MRSASMWARCCASRAGDELYELVEGDRADGHPPPRRRAGCRRGANCGARVPGGRPELARDLVRAFSTWFQLVNVAEKVHRIRRRREYFLAEAAGRSRGGVVDALAELKAQGLALADMLRAAGGSCASSRCWWRIRPSRRGAPDCGASSASPTCCSSAAIRCWRRRSGAPAGAHPRRDHHRLADRRASARAADGGRRARARDVLSGRGAVPDRAGVLRGDRRPHWRSSTAPTPSAGAAAHRALRHLGGRRHGRPAGSARQEHPRDAGAPAAGDHQQLLRRVPAAGAAAVAERRAAWRSSRRR